MGKWFGTDGVRGVANTELTPELAYRLGRCAAHQLTRSSVQPHRIVVGRDTRISGDMLECALMAGICSVGADALRVGVLPTPAIAYLTRALGAQAGVVISASHNKVEDNGVKFFSSQGFKVPDQDEEAIESLVERLEAGDDQLPRPPGAKVGRVIEVAEATDLYLGHIRQQIPVVLRGMRVVMDCAHGAASVVAPRLFRALGAEVLVQHAEPNGLNINVDSGSTNPANLMRMVKTHSAQLGLAFDGDADRLIAVDEQGSIVDGDRIMNIFARFLKARQRLSGDVLVTTVMSNFGLELALGEVGVKMVRTRVGDRFVLEEMQRLGAVLGGEQSGHIILLEHNTTGDGLVTATQLAAVIKETGQPLSQLASQMASIPQHLDKVRVPARNGWDQDHRIQEAISNASRRLEGRGRVLVRASGTEPVIRVMAEGPDHQEILEIVSGLCALISERLGT